MMYEAVSTPKSANASVFNTESLQTPATIATKKVIDISSKLLKVGNIRLHFLNAAMPIIGLMVSLVGLMLQAYATLRDKGKPRWLKALAFLVLGATAALTVAIFALSVQFPPIALALSFSAIALSVVLQTVDFMNSLCCLGFAKWRLSFPSKKDSHEEIAYLNGKRSLLFKQQTSIISALNHENDEKIIAQLQKKLRYTQNKLIKTEKRIDELKNPLACAQKAYAKRKREMIGGSIGLLFCLCGSILGVIGLTLAVGNPLLGLALIGIGFIFDAIILSRKSNKFMRRKNKASLKRKAHEEKCQHLVSESVNTLNNEHAKTKRSYTSVINQFNHQKVRLKPVELSDTKQAIPNPINQELDTSCKAPFFLSRQASNDKQLETIRERSNVRSHH